MPTSDFDPDDLLSFEERWQRQQEATKRTLARLRRRSRRPQTRQSSRRSQRDIRQLATEFDKLKTDLEEHAVSWQNLGTPFWMAVRFGGLGIVIGWGLCLLTLGDGQRQDGPTESGRAPRETVVVSMEAQRGKRP